MRLRWTAALASVAIAAIATIGASSAQATAPVQLGTGYIVDQVGVLSGSEADQAESELTQVYQATGADLYVVFVDEFTDPANSQEWADAVAENNGLGASQYVLAVAVEGRQFYVSADSGGPLSEQQLAQLDADISAELRVDDYSGAITAAAESITRSLTAQGTSGSWLTWVLVAAVVAAGIALLVVLIRRRRRPTGSVTDGTPGAAAPQASIEELQKRAASLLIETDDALKTSTQELGFANAQFGEAATAEFEATLAGARQGLDEAFTIKQRLDDAIPDTEQQTRAGYERIIALCEAANTQLDEKAADFDELRKLEQNAPEALLRVQGERAKAAASLADAETQLRALGASYAPEALATVADNPDQARQRLAFADEQLTAAQAAIGAGDGGDAAVGIRAAEEAVAQAALLEQAIGKLGADLAAGERNATALVVELEGDIATASALPDPDGRLAGAIEATRRQLDAARTHLTGTAKRPLIALQALEAANQQIDALVQGVRDAQAQAQRARQMVGQLILQAQAQVSAAEDYITARRGAVGADARTRLAEAGASLARAQALQQSDPQQATQHAQRADQLAGQAIQLAQNDVGAFGAQGGGVFGGAGQSDGGGMLGAVLGGIVLNSVLGGGRSSGGSGGGLGGVFGGSSGRSSGRGGGMRPGSFGGGGTRGRRGGGRF